MSWYKCLPGSHQLRHRGRLGNNLTCDGDGLGGCLSRQNKNETVWRCIGCDNFDLCRPCHKRYMVDLLATEKRQQRPNVDTKLSTIAKSEEVSISRGGGNLSRSSSSESFRGGIFAGGVKVEDPDFMLELSEDEDSEPVCGVVHSRVRSSQQLKSGMKTKRNDRLKLIIGDDGFGIGAGAAVVVQLAEDERDAIFQFIEGEIVDVKIGERHVQIHWTKIIDVTDFDENSVCATYSCDDSVDLNMFQEAIEGQLNELGHIVQKKLRLDENDREVTITCFFNKTTEATAFSNYLNGPAFLLQVAAILDTQLYQISREGTCELTIEHTPFVKKLKLLTCRKCNFKTLSVYEIKKHRMEGTKCYNDMNASGEELKTSYETLDTDLIMDVSAFSEQKLREHVLKLQSHFNSLKPQSPTKRVGKHIQGTLVNSRKKAGLLSGKSMLMSRCDFILLNGGMSGYFPASDSFSRRISSFDQLYNTFDLSHLSGVANTISKTTKKVAVSSEKKFVLKWKPLQTNGEEDLGMFTYTCWFN